MSGISRGTASVLELRRGPPKTRKPPQSIQSPEGVHLIPSRDGRIELRGPSAPSARLAEDIRIYREPGRRSARTYGSVVRLRRPTRPRPLGEPANPAVPIRLKTKRPSSIAAEEPNRDGRIRTGDPLNPIRLPDGLNHGKKRRKSLVGRTICNSCVKPMLTAAALNRHKNRPNRHTNRPKMRAGDLLGVKPDWGTPVFTVFGVE